MAEPALRLVGHREALRRDGRGRRHRSRRERRRVRHAARAVGLRQDHDARPHRRLLPADGGRDLSQGQAGRRPAVVPARHRRRVPGLRAVPAHDRRARTSRSACACATCRRRRSRSASRTRSTSCSSPASASAGRCRCPAASASASRSRARSSSTRRCCCSTSRCRTSTSSCARRCASRSPRIQRRLGITTVFVTHDQGEALVMSDRIAVMNAGRIEQIGDPADIYERPATRFVAEFIGRMNLFAGAGDAGAQRAHGATGVEIAVPVPRGPRDRRGRARRGPARARAPAARQAGATAWRCGAPCGRCSISARRASSTSISTAASAASSRRRTTAAAPPFEPGARVWLAASFANCRVLPA